MNESLFSQKRERRAEYHGQRQTTRIRLPEGMEKACLESGL
ncbi:MAG: hypothetical protein ACLS6G_12800 [Christensenellales bacterium]